jgi:hypothetical protein
METSVVSTSTLSLSADVCDKHTTSFASFTNQKGSRFHGLAPIFQAGE